MLNTLFAPLDGVIDATLSRHCGRYIDTGLSKKILDIQDKNGKSYQLYFYEDEKYMIYVIKDVDKMVGGLTFKRIQKDCVNKAFEIIFGGISKDYRGLGMAQQLCSGIFVNHTNHVSDNGVVTGVYLSLGKVFGPVMEYIGVKEFGNGNYRAWLCKTVDDISDATEITNDLFDDTKKRQIKFDVLFGKNIFIAAK